MSDNFYDNEVRKMDNEIIMDKIHAENYKNSFINELTKIDRTDIINVCKNSTKMKKPWRVRFNTFINKLFKTLE